MEKELWEILIPTVYGDNGETIPEHEHKIWDQKAKSISLENGLTILRPAKGHWSSPEGEIFVEDMIPIRLIVSETEIRNIVDFTIRHFRQKAVLAYRLSDKYILKYNKQL